jgi:hypothetical protein
MPNQLGSFMASGQPPPGAEGHKFSTEMRRGGMNNLNLDDIYKASQKVKKDDETQQTNANDTTEIMNTMDKTTDNV